METDITIHAEACSPLETLTDLYEEMSEIEESEISLRTSASRTLKRLSKTSISMDELTDFLRDYNDKYSTSYEQEMSAAALSTDICDFLDIAAETGYSLKDISRLMDSYEQNSDSEEYTPELKDATYRTLQAMPKNKDKAENLNYTLLLIEAYHYSSTISERASSVRSAVCSTLSMIENTDYSSKDITDLIDAYSSESSEEESPSSLSNAVYETLETLHMTNKTIQDAIEIIKAYNGASSDGENSETLCDAACKTLKYSAAKGLGNEEVISRINRSKKELADAAEKEYESKKREIEWKYSFVSKYMKLIGAQLDYSCTTISAADLCKRLTSS